MVPRSLMLSFAVGLFVGLGQGPLAVAADLTENRAVRLVDLDVSQDRDAERAAARIAKAALEVCGGGRGSLEIVNSSVMRSACRSQAVDRAASQLGAPKVSAALAAAAGR